MSVEKWAFPALKPWGILFIFWTFQAAGRDPSTSFLFIITNYQFVIFHITIQFAQQSPQKLPSFQLLSNLSNLHLTPSKPSLQFSNHFPSLPGVHFPWQNDPKIYPHTLSYIHPQISHFPSKIPKNGLKSLFFNR